MARPSRPWFRFYVESARDPKIRRLTPAERWLWVAVLCAARESCVPGRLMVAEHLPMTEDEIAELAGLKKKETVNGLMAMIRLGMLNREDDGVWVVRNWDARQFESDNVTARTAKHRSKERSLERSNDVPGNGPETETETERPPLPPTSGGGKLSTRASGHNPRALAAHREAERMEHDARRLGQELAVDGVPAFKALETITRRFATSPSAIALAERTYQEAAG